MPRSPAGCDGQAVTAIEGAKVDAVGDQQRMHANALPTGKSARENRLFRHRVLFRLQHFWSI
jgi:hypothetical protein